MVHGYHATFGTYGSFLPNDPRGSHSKFVGSESLYLTAGRVTPDRDQAYEQLSKTDRNTIRRSQAVLRRPHVVLDEVHRALTAAAIGMVTRKHKIKAWALAIMPCHIHLVFARGKTRSEDFVDSTKALVESVFSDAMCLPLGCDADHSPWAEGKWIKYLDSESAIENAIDYVVANPIESGRPPQNYPFIEPFRGIEFGLTGYNV